MNISSKRIRRIFPDGRFVEKDILVLNEHKLSVRVNGMLFCNLVCTGENLMELVAGHLLSSGLIEKKSEISSIFFCETKNNATVFLSKDFEWNENAKSEESCCPKNEQFLKIENSLPPEKLPPVDYKPEWIFALANAFSSDGVVHKYTSGTHICILARKGKPVFTAEDIGRHTALDKALGYMLLNDIPPCDAMIFTSGRVPVDMVEKVIRARVGILVSKSVPTSDSLSLAKKYGLKLFFRAWPDSYDCG
ncbi:MAG: formate dehydrogenase accessory sulfurtransferase FdhD [Treponema sp.]|nr:formate dehydrogenase accessory sulfurtransferase FdhD [Treponema sp.]